MNIRELLGPRYEVHIVHNKKESYTKALGNTPSLLTALSCFISALKESGIAEGPIKYAVEQGLNKKECTDEELKMELDKLIKKILD